jgi:hypothetical protein
LPDCVFGPVACRVCGEPIPGRCGRASVGGCGRVG